MPIEPSDLEMAYRAEYHQESQYIDRKRIACATCGTSLTAKLKERGAVFVHPLLDTLQCKKCHLFYGDGDFSMDEDGSDKYCRMCGNGGELYICGKQSCPFGFCQKCIYRHLGGNSNEVESDDWNCLHCNCKPLWEVRAVCAVIALERSRKPRKHRKETTRSERIDDSSQSEDSDSDLENTKPRSSRSRHKYENKCFQSNMRRTSRRSSKDSHDSINRRRNSNVSKQSGTSQKYVLRKATGPSSPMRRVRELSESNDDESFVFEEERTWHRIRCSTKSIDAFAQAESQLVKKHNNGDHSNHSIKRQQKIRPSSPKVDRTKVESLERLKKLTNNSDSTSSDGSTNEFVRNKKKRKLKSNKDRFGINNTKAQKVKGDHLEKSNSKANQSRSSEKIKSLAADRKTPESSLESKRTSRESSTHSFTDLETKRTKSKIQRNRFNSSGSDGRTESARSRVFSNTANVPGGTGINRHLTDSENENISVAKIPQTRTKVLSPNLNREPEKAQPTKRLSTKPRHHTYLSSSSAEYDKQLLGARKASIKLCQKKFASNKDSVTKDQATAMRKHAENLMREIKMLRVGSSAGAEKIIQRHLPKDETSVAAISKMVQTCALLLVRCKEKWVRIEREFLDSYKDWCQRAEIKSIFADMENPDVVESNQVEKPSVDKSMENKVTQNRATKETLSNSTENSDASGDDNCKIANQLACNLSRPISTTANFRSGTKEKLEPIRIGLGNTKSPRKVNRSTLHLSNKDSDGDSITSKNDELSECDSNEIFSEDENRRRTDTTTKPLNKNIIGNSFTANAIKSDSNEGEKVDGDNLQTVGEESMHSGKAESHRSNLSDNIQQGNQPSEKLSRIQVRTDNTDQLKSSQDISKDDPNNVSKTPSKKDQCSLNASSCVEDIPMSSELSAPPETDIPGQGTNEGLDDTQIADSLPLAELDDNVNDVSGCDAATILDHSKSDNSTTNSETCRVIKSPKSTASVDKSEEAECMSVGDMDSMEIVLQNDIGVKSDELNSSKDRSLPIVSSPHLHKGATNLDSDISLEGESDASEVCNERRKNEKVTSHSTALANRDKQTDSVGENQTIGAKKNETTEAHSDECSNSEAEIERKKSESDSEEAIKKKILESDSELSNDSSEVPFRSDSFKLTVTSSSEEYPSKQVPAGPGTATITTSEVSNIGKESEDLENSENELETNSTSPASVVDANDDISIRNNLAKQRLLSDSDSSGSDEMTFNPSWNLDRRKSDSASSPSNDEIFVGTINSMESTSMPSSNSKRKKFNLERNDHYKTDKKLQVDCKVLVRRLKEKDLEPFSQLLTKSREHRELENFKSLVDLDNIKKRRKGSRAGKQSGSESSLSESSSKGPTKKKKSKKVQEKEETLLDHFEKMKNGDNYCNLSGDETDEDNVALENALPGAVAENEIIMESNQVAKAKLMQSSDSENDMQTSIGNDDEPEPEEQSKVKATTKKQKAKDIANEEGADAESSHENGSNTEKDNDETANIEEDSDPEESDNTRKKKRLKQGLAARNWRLTDSDSSSQERKWTKSQELKGEEKSIEPKELGSRNKKKVKRRVLGSDSDSVKLTDLSDESADEKDDKKNSSDSENSSEIFESLRKKKRKKRNAGQNSETTSESGQDAKSAKQKRKRIKKMESDSDSDSDNPNNSQDTPGKLQRKNIRKVLKDKQVADVTKIAGKEEEERLKRIAERQKLYNEMYEMKLATETKVDKLILDFDEETKKELISVHEGLVKRLKPHQAQGIKFMWDACFESLAQIKSTQGSGCIVAHCMGLGKTFQVVTLAHTLLTHAETGVKTIMVVCPLSTVLNWVNEFKKWLGDINNDEDVEVFEMTKMKKNIERKYQLERWQRAGGVMVLGYEMFRLLSNQKGKKMRKSLHEAILKCLVDPGPDLIVCDEGHLLKNEDTALSKAMRQVKTMRRIVLTGTPLQNNLVEYHCMVQFVKPNLLGTKKEFLNRFVNPITNGQFEDSTEYDVKLMKKRAHVLHKMLEGSVQRFDYSVLTPFLPPKQEYVITVRLADIQIKLYQYYLDNLAKKHTGAGTSLFADFQALQRIWTHPIVLRMNAEKVEKANEKKRMDMDTSDSEGSLKDFLDDGSSEKSTTSADSDIQSIDGSSDDKPSKPRRGTRANPVDEATFKLEDEETPQAGEWWNQFVEPEHFEDLRISSKLVLLFAILKEAEQIGDKVLVFSQSLYALSLIEEFLNKIDDDTQRGTCNELIDNHSGSWSLGLDYFRLDGQTAPEHRSQYCRIFNNPKNSRARLFLISTRAGGLGINLTAANRVIIFDASWNPSHDVQSIFRIYRFGQKKPCYVYRFLAQGTMEEKIYNRQVTKLSLSCRVVDEQQIDRHYSNHDLAELYQFDANTSADKPTLNLPKDRLLAEIFRKYEDRIETFHEHDSLLENKAEEELDEEERKEAWKEYEDERTGKRTYMHNFPNQNFAMQQYNDMLNMNQADIVNRALLSGINIETLETLIRKDYPNSTPEQQKMMTQRAIIDMYSYMESESIRQQQMAAAAAAAAANNFTYPTVSNVGAASFADKNATSQGRQYALQQQQQLHQIMAQRDAQANYAKRFGNVRGPALSAAPTRQQPQVVQIDDNDVMEVPVTSPATTTPVPTSSVQTSAVPAPGGNSKRQEE